MIKSGKKLEVYDAYAEARGAGPTKVAEVVVQNGKGKLVVLDEAFTAELEDVFERTTRMAGGAPDAEGMGADAPVDVKPYSDEALDHAIRYGLPAHNLRGVLTAHKR